MWIVSTVPLSAIDDGNQGHGGPERRVRESPDIGRKEVTAHAESLHICRLVPIGLTMSVTMHGLPRHRALS